MTTSSVSYTVPSNSWTGSIDVTDCDLSTDISVFDVRIFYDNVEQGSSETANWSKVSVTSLSYSGSALNMGDVVRIERETPATQIVTVLPLQTISSGAWNAEFTRIYNILEEQRIYGLATEEITVSDETYGSGWNGITTQAPSKNAIYDKIETLLTSSSISDTAFSTSWNGVTDIAPSKNAVYDKIAQIQEPIDRMCGRITVTSGTPVVTTQTSSSTIYYTPYMGNYIYLYDGSSTWERFTLSEISLALSGTTSNRPYDVFIYSNSGTPTIEILAWTDDTTRATALTLQNGILVKSGQTTRRYVGTIVPVSNSVSQGDKTESANVAFRNDVYNFYNKVVGTYRNSQGLTPAATPTAWYTNQLITVINGYYDDFNWSMTLHVAGYNTSTSGILRIHSYDVNASAIDIADSLYVPSGVSSNSCGASLHTQFSAARQFGKASAQALTSYTFSSWSIDSSRVVVSFCY